MSVLEKKGPAQPLSPAAQSQGGREGNRAEGDPTSGVTPRGMAARARSEVEAAKRPLPPRPVIGSRPDPVEAARPKMASFPDIADTRPRFPSGPDLSGVRAPRPPAPPQRAHGDELPLPLAASLDWDDGNPSPPAELPAEPEESAEEEEGPDPYIGTTLGDRYVVDAVIGEGGMGRVYLAHHKVIGKKVAVKLLHAELAKDKESVSRFVREAKAASSIGNPHIVDISDFGESPDGSTYFVMEYLEGRALADMLDGVGALPTELVCEVVLQICDGLAAAHKRDIVHRDLKPDNITLVRLGDQENFVKILDFGIAKVSTGTSNTKLTMAGAVFGTPHYMSPEQAAGAQVDVRTDIYSLGVMMYEMTSGEMPFNADNFMGILTQHMYKAPVPIRALVSAPDCPPGLEAIVLKCLSKKADARYQTMEELAADIRKFQQTGMPDAVQEMMARSGSFNVPVDYFKSPPVLPATPHAPPSRFNPRWVAVAGIAVAVGLVLVVVMRDSASDAQTQPEAGQPTATPLAAETAPIRTPATEKAGTVLVASDPIDAHATIAGTRYELPWNVPIKPGEKIRATVERDGYISQTVELDASQQKVLVKLVPEAPKRPPVATSGAARAPVPRNGKGKTGKDQPKTSGGDTVDPWAN